jgi:hypothetical protein
MTARFGGRLKRHNALRESACTAMSFEITVALGATVVRKPGQLDVAVVFLVTG